MVHGLTANTLVDSKSFGNWIKSLLSILDRVIVDTTELIEIETQMAVASICDVTIMAIDGEGVTPRKTYKKTADLLAIRGLKPVVTIYLRETSFAKVSSVEQPEYCSTTISDFLNVVQIGGTTDLLDTHERELKQ